MPAPAKGVRTRLGAFLVARVLNMGLQRESCSVRASGLEHLVSLSAELLLMGYCQARQGLQSGQGTGHSGRGVDSELPWTSSHHSGSPPRRGQKGQRVLLLPCPSREKHGIIFTVKEGCLKKFQPLLKGMY